jgi:hypothetical protein
MATAKQRAEVGRMVADHLAEKRLVLLEKAGITFERISHELAAMAFSNIEDYVEVAEGGEVQAIPLSDVGTDKLKAVKKIREKTNIAESKDGETIFKRSELEYELYDKADALKYCVKLLGEEPAEQINHSVDLSPELEEMFSLIVNDGRLQAPVKSKAKPQPKKKATKKPVKKGKK